MQRSSKRASLECANSHAKYSMRYIELISGVRVPISEEEQELIDMITEGGELNNSSLDERQQEVARLMVSRGTIKQAVVEQELIFSLDNEKLTRF